MRFTSPDRTVPVTVIGGYLGSGKTTLVNELLRGTHGLRVAVLVNDFGTVNIDAELIQNRRGEIISLANGCVCCSISDNLATAFRDQLERRPRPDHIVIEVSGVSDPRRVAQYGLAVSGLRLDGVIVLADAETIRRRSLDKYVGTTVRRQLQAADLLVLSKVDRVDAQERHAVRAWLQDVAPATPVVDAVKGHVPADLILGAHPQPSGLPAETPCPSPALDDDHGTIFESCLYTSSTPLDRAALVAALDAMPRSLLRMKGAVYLADDASRRIMLQSVGRHWELVASGPWGDVRPESRVVGIALAACGAGDDLQRLMQRAALGRRVIAS